MKRSRTRRSAVTYLVLQITTAALALWLSKQFHVARMSTTLIALAPTVPGAYLAWAAYRSDRTEAATDTDAKAKALAAIVTATETRQRAQLIKEGAHPIDLAFHYRPERAHNASGAAPTGTFTEVVTYYRNLRPARLVITGKPGAGKTLLAINLILGLLTIPDRSDADPVPLRFSLASWDTDRPLPEWLADQLHQQFRVHGLTPADAELLVEQYRILPVLDGLDEMDTDERDTDTARVGRRRAARALQQLNAYQDPTGNAPVILTCRTTQYEGLAEHVWMREAARIQIDPVTPDQAAAYLTERSTDPARWTTVIDTLTTDPGGTVAQALNTPWRLNLAATAYEERHPDTLAYLRKPADLLNLANPNTVRDDLLTRYLPAAISQHPTRYDRYTADQAHRWLGELATHLAPTSTPPESTASRTDIALHQLWPMAGPRRVRVTDALLSTLATTSAAIVILTFLGSPASLTTALTLALVPPIAWQVSRPVVPEPQTFQLQQLRSPAHRRWTVQTLTGALVAGLVAGCVAGLLFGLLFGLTSGSVVGSVVGLVGGLAVAFAVGLAVALTKFMQPLKDVLPTDPRYPVRDDLLLGLVGIFVSALVFGLVGGCLGAFVYPPLGGLVGDFARIPVIGLAGGLIGGCVYGVVGRRVRHLVYGIVFGFTIGLAGVLLGGLWYGFSSRFAALLVGVLVGGLIGLLLGGFSGSISGASLGGATCRYLAFLCCTRGRLPWRFGSFLHWAHEAGLLRISGVAYQFRHRELQDWLAAHPSPDSHPPAATESPQQKPELTSQPGCTD